MMNSSCVMPRNSAIRGAVEHQGVQLFQLIQLRGRERSGSQVSVGVRKCFSNCQRLVPKYLSQIRITSIGW